MRYFIDMDGTLAKNPTFEKWWEEPGVFEELPPIERVVKAIKRMIRHGAEVYILSAYNKEFPNTVDEKNIWLNKYLPEIDQSHRIFSIFGEDKVKYVPGGISTSDVLLDDLKANLDVWSANGGIAIQLINGLDTQDHWNGIAVSSKSTIKNIVAALNDLDNILSDIGVN